jgi:hypothetical protein
MFVCQMYIINKPPFLNQQRLMHNVEVAIQRRKGLGYGKRKPHYVMFCLVFTYRLTKFKDIQAWNHH